MDELIIDYLAFECLAPYIWPDDEDDTETYSLIIEIEIEETEDVDS